MAEPAREAQTGEAEPGAQLTLEPLPLPSQAASGALAGKMEAVCVAAMRGELQAVQAALELAAGETGYSINAQGSSGRTALYQACLGRRPEIVKYLLELGAVRSCAALQSAGPRLMRLGAMLQTDEDGSAYIAICATGRGDSRSEDPAERTAAVMREHNWGPASSARKRRAGGGRCEARAPMSPWFAYKF